MLESTCWTMSLGGLDALPVDFSPFTARQASLTGEINCFLEGSGFFALCEEQGPPVSSTKDYKSNGPSSQMGRCWMYTL